MNDGRHFEVAVIGGGNMGAALLRGMLDAGVVDVDDVVVCEVVEERRDELSAMFPGVEVRGDVATATSVIIAVKPHHVDEAVRAAVDAGARRVLSVAAGVRLAALEAATGGGVAVCRAMPNTPALIGAGYAALAAGPSAGSDDVEFARRVLAAVGRVDEMPEADLDAVTGVAGSGPAYVFVIAEALIEAAVREGITRPIAERMVSQLLLGASSLLAREGEPARLRAQVTSPGGTTAAGLAELEAHGIRATMLAAVRAATVRSRELG